MNFADLIKELREQKGVSTYEIARALDINPSGITRWEKDGAYPNMETIRKLCDFFDVSADYLIGRSTSRKEITRERRLAEIPVVKNDKSFQFETITHEDYPLSFLNGGRDWDYFISTVLDEAMLPLISPKIDQLLIKKQDDFQSGDYVFFTTRSSEAFVRKLFKTGGGVEMQSKNPYFPVRAVKRDSIKVYGIVTRIIKNIQEGIQNGY